MEIDRDAPATAEGERRIEATPEAVWAVMADIEAWPTWNTDVREATLEGPLAPGTVFRWRAGTRLISRLEVVDPPTEIGWTGRTLGIPAVHVYRFEPSDGGTAGGGPSTAKLTSTTAAAATKVNGIQVSCRRGARTPAVTAAPIAPLPRRQHRDMRTRGA